MPRIKGNKGKLVRLQNEADTKLLAGKGLSEAVSKSLKSRRLGPEFLRPKKSFDGVLRRSNLRLSILSKSVVSTISTALNVEEYEFPEEDETIDPQKFEAKLDVTALDRYNEDVRRLRKLLIDECRAIPTKGDPDARLMAKVKMCVRCLCRTTYYGTHKAQALAEGAVILIVWLLSRRNIKTGDKVHILQSLAEMVWTSSDLKMALYKCSGIRIITRLMVSGIKQKADIGRWACYTLAMSCISSTEAIAAVLEIDRIDEVVGEIAFYYYWTNWPANFGSILQGILFGPHSVIPLEDSFDFI